MLSWCYFNLKDLDSYLLDSSSNKSAEIPRTLPHEVAVAFVPKHKGARVADTSTLVLQARM